jgi:PAS domain S-box-containing protein
LFSMRNSSFSDGHREYFLKRRALLSDSVLHFRTVAQVFGVSIVDAIVRGTMTTLVVSTVGSILGRPSKLTSDRCCAQTRVTGSRKRCHLPNFLLLLAFSVVFRTIAIAEVPEVRRVLVLNDFNEIASPGIALLDQGIFAALSHSRYQIEWYSESLEANLFTDEASQRRILDGYIRKYKDRKLDLIIAVGPASLQFMVESHEKLFPGVAIVFCGSSEDMLKKLKPDSSFTGVWGVVQPEETLIAALRLQPGTKHVVVVGGVGTYDRHLEDIVHQSLRNYESRLEFTYLTNLDMPTLLRRVGQLPGNTIILYTSIFRDAAGRHFIDANQSSPAVIDASNAPVFILFDVNFGTGAIGGDIISFASDGNVAGHMAVRILDGEQPQTIHVVKNADVWTFDWRALRRWGFKETDLPPGSIVLDREPSFWELYKQYFVAGIFLVLAQFAAILGLLWQRARRRKTEAQLIRSEEKFSKSFRQSPLAIKIASTKDGRYIDVNETFGQQTGWGRDEVIGRSPSDINLWVDPDQRSLFIKQLLAEGNVRDLEVRIRRKDGQIRTTLVSAELIEVNGKPCALSVLADITERKVAEAALANVSRKLIEAQEQERTRIGRELHDDVTQRLAMLALELEQLEGNPSEVRSRVQELRKQTTEISNDVQALSHELHSSKVEYLGAVRGMKSWCNEFSDRQGLQIEFKSPEAQIPLRREIGLSLFRVLQEALHNAAKHSGVRRIEVQLREDSGEVHLVISDLGRGFDLETAVQGRGLGLTSMQERIRLVNGTIEIQSKPMGGTTVHVRVPLRSENVPQRVAG